MNKLFKNPSYKANIGYNGFNMQQRLKFTSTVGELLPVYFDLLQPGDKVTCSEELKTRTLPLESPAMCSITENFDWFFVPLEQIYKLFGSWYFRIDDHSSSIFDFTNIYDQIPAIDPTTLTAIANDMAVSWGYFSSANASDFRLAEMLGIPMFEIHSDNSAVSAVQPMFACAYQKIYFDYYRLPDRERTDPEAYNLDKFYNTASISQAAGRKMFKLRYAPWHKDFFTNLFVSPIFGQGTISAIGENANQAIQSVNKLFQQWLTSTNFDTFDTGTWTVSVVNSPNPSGRTEMTPNSSTPTQIAPSGITPQINSGQYFQQLGNLQNALSPSSIRTSFALQKMLEVTRRAGKHYDAQQLAHFGVKLPSGISGEVTFLGNHSSVIHIGDVVSTADTTTGVLGQQAGKGYGYSSNNGTIKFTAPCHGILMCIYNAIPEVDYTDSGLDKLHTLINPYDWYRPEFDNLGMQPLFMYQSSYDTTSPTVNATILGWQYRFSELKTKYNRVVGGLKTGSNLSHWTTQRAFQANTLNSFLVNPTFLNSIMTVGYAPTVGNPFNSDPLIHEVVFSVNKASKMSTYGLEQL